MRTILIMIAILAGEMLSGQNGFMVHYDSIQAGRGGVGSSISEVDSGYLLFCRQYSQDVPNRQHIYVRRLSITGEILDEFEHRVGENKDFDIGYIDPVATDPDGTYATAMAEGFFYPSETWFYIFGQNGDTISRKFVMTYPPEDSITHSFRHIRTPPTERAGWSSTLIWMRQQRSAYTIYRAGWSSNTSCSQINDCWSLICGCWRMVCTLANYCKVTLN